MLKLYKHIFSSVLLLLCSFYSLFPQLQVTSGQTALQLVNNIVGPGYTITNIKMNCPAIAAGAFVKNTSNITINNGILLTTGSAAMAIGPNNRPDQGFNNGTAGDGDLDSLANIGRAPGTLVRTYDACVLEFDMEPACDTFRIRFAFASEEYTEYIGSSFNDVFGFFITGPGLGGKVNLAKVPATTQNISVNTIHPTVTNTFGTTAAQNVQYYVGNLNPQASPKIQYDGFTTLLEQKIKLSVCNVYHLKIAIADVDDGIFDSGVFIEGNSIHCNPVVYNDIATNINGIEGCNSGSFRFCRTGDSSKVHTIPIRIGGTAVNGVDYKTLNDTVIVPAGQGCVTINLQPIDDGIFEPTETVKIFYKHGACPVDDSLEILINDPPPFNAGPNKIICSGDTVQVGLLPTAGYSYTWSPGTGISNINISNPNVTLVNTTSNPVTYHYTVSVTSATSCIVRDSITVVVRPAPVASFTMTGACTNSPIPITNLSQPTGTGATLTSWLWSLGNNLYDTVKNPSPIYTTSGSFPIILTVTDNFGCTDTAKKNVTIYPLPVANFSTVALCEGDSVTFTNQSTVGSGTITNFTWNFGDGSPASNLSNPKHLYPPGPGSYSVTLTVASNSNCKSTITKSVYITTGSINAGPGRTICSGDTTQVGATLPTAGYSYTWSPATGISNINSSNPYITLINSTTVAAVHHYTVTARSPSNCTFKDSITVIVRPKPLASFTVTGACTNSPIKITDQSIAYSGATIKTWNWSLGNNLFDTVKNPAPIYQNSGTYLINVIVIDNYGCTDDTSQSVTIYPLPNADFSTANACEGDSVSLINSSTVPNGTIASSIWSFGDGSPLSGVTNPKHIYPAGAGTYTVQLIVTSNFNCVSTTSKAVEIYPKPILDFKADPACINAVVRFYNNSNGDYYKWYFGDGDSSGLRNPKHTYITSGIKNVKLVGTTLHGCKDSLVKTVEIYPKPIANFTLVGDTGCATLCVNLQDLTTVIANDSIASWQWVFNSGIVVGTSNFIRCFDKDGIYSPGLIVTSAKGCTDTTFKSTNIIVYPKPTAAFDLSPAFTTIYDPIITFTDRSGEKITKWDFGDKTIDSLLAVIKHTYLEPGLYTITQVVQNQWGCMDTITHTLRIDPETAVFVPNAFTPDGNGINDNFFPKVSGYLLEANFKMYIYDRWGNRVFTSSDLSYQWNGKANGGKNFAQQDVYSYIIIFTDKETNEELKKLTGHVTLVR